MAEQNDMGFNTAKLKRGFYWWVALTFAGAIGVLWYALDASYRGRLDDKDKEILRVAKERDEFKKERDEFKYYVLPKLRELQPTIEATAKKIDSITQK